jgi:hypothetical protein
VGDFPSAADLVYSTVMTVADLIERLENLNRRDLEVRIYVPNHGGVEEAAVWSVRVEEDTYDPEHPDVRVILK